MVIMGYSNLYKYFGSKILDEWLRIEIKGKK
jgi:hypothetical protein